VASIRHLLKFSQYNVHQTSNSAALAQKTFAVTELLEMILLNLSPWTLLTAQRTNRQFFNTIEESSKIQQKMMLQQSGTQHFSTLLSRETYHKYDNFVLGLSYVLEMPDHLCQIMSEAPNIIFAGTAPLSMEFFVIYAPHSLPRIGARCRKILICEPIITEIKVYPECCGKLGPSEYLRFTESRLQDSVFEISNPTGITIGDIYEALCRVEEHPGCRFRGVQFYGYTDVIRTDPNVKWFMDNPPWQHSE
jgi:hypothetical protein